MSLREMTVRHGCHGRGVCRGALELPAQRASRGLPARHFSLSDPHCPAANAAAVAPGRPVHRRGTILYAVLVLSAMLAAIGVGVMFRLQTHNYAAGVAASALQARLAALAGVQQALAVLASGQQERTAWQDNEALFRQRLVGEAGPVRWYFTVYAPGEADDMDGIRYGLIDESGLINVNTATAATLAGLPGMSSALADAVVDYRDEDSQSGPEGAEQDYYDRLGCPYVIANRPLATVEELLLVRGFTAGLVFGEDANRNGLLDACENDGDESFPPDDHDGELDGGLAELLTAASYEPRGGAEGDRFNINGDLAGLDEVDPNILPASAKSFIRLYRGEREFNDFQELIRDYTLEADHGELGAIGDVIRAGLTPDDLPRLEEALVIGEVTPLEPADPNEPGEPEDANEADGDGWEEPDPNEAGEQDEEEEESDEPERQPSSWVQSQRRLLADLGDSSWPALRPGRLNVNVAPARVLAMLPGVDRALAERIVQTRQTLEAEQMKTPSWLCGEGLLDDETYKRLAPMLTTRGYQYRLRCVGFGVPAAGSRPPSYCVLEAVLDLSGPRPRVAYLRDLTRMGLPFALGPPAEAL